MTSRDMANVTEVELTVTCKPFTTFRRGKYRVLVDLDESLVRVWDHIGHHFTLLHSLSEASQRTILARARNSIKE